MQESIRLYFSFVFPGGGLSSDGQRRSTIIRSGTVCEENSRINDPEMSDLPEQMLPGVWFHESVLWVIYAVSVLLALCPWNPGGIPAGLYADEVQKLNQLRHLLETGHDMWGLSYPFYDQVYLSLALPWTWVAGVNPASLRTFSVLLIVISSLLFFRIGRHYGWDRRLACMGMVLFFLSPSLLTVKRFILEVNALILTLTLAWFLWLRALEKGTFWTYAAGGLAWGGMTYSYTSARSLVLFYFGFLATGSWLKKGVHRRGALVALAAFGIALIPFVIQIIVFKSLLGGRFGEVSVMKQSGASALVTRAPLNYLNIVFVLLWFDGDPNLRHHFGPLGETYLAFLPLVAIGLWWSWRNRREIRQMFLLWGFCVFPLPAVATKDALHNLRILHVVPFLVILAGQGVRALVRRDLRWKPVVGILMGLALLQGITLAVHYTAAYRTASSNHYFSGSFDAIERALEVSRGKRVLVHECLFIDETGMVDLDRFQFNIIHGYGLLLDPLGLKKDEIEKHRYDHEATYPPGVRVLIMCPTRAFDGNKKDAVARYARMLRINPREYRILERWPGWYRGVEHVKWDFLLLEKKG